MTTPLDARDSGDTVGCPVHHGYEPFEQKNPFPAYAALRREEPVVRFEIDYPSLNDVFLNSVRGLPAAAQPVGAPSELTPVGRR